MCLPEGRMYTRYRGTVQGPFSPDELQVLAKRGSLSRLYQLSRDGSKWVSAAQYPGLFPKAEIRAPVPPPVPEPAPAAVVPEAPSAESADVYALQPEAAASPGAESADWYYVVNGEEMGPVDFEQLRLLAAMGQVNAEDYVWCDFLPDWVPAGSLPDLFARGQEPAITAASAVAAPPASGEGRPTQTCGMAVASFVLGLLGATLFFAVGSVLAIVFGHVALTQIENSRNTLGGRGMAVAGLILGYVVIGIAAIAGLIVLFAIGAFARMF